jgi:hypothetical protein
MAECGTLLTDATKWRLSERYAMECFIVMPAKAGIHPLVKPPRWNGVLWMDMQDQIEDLTARLEAHRDWIANFVISITYHFPDLELTARSSLTGTCVEGAEQQQMAAYLDELRQLRDRIEPVLDARQLEKGS